MPSNKRKNYIDDMFWMKDNIKFLNNEHSFYWTCVATIEGCPILTGFIWLKTTGLYSCNLALIQEMALVQSGHNSGVSPVLLLLCKAQHLHAFFILAWDSFLTLLILLKSVFIPTIKLPLLLQLTFHCAFPEWEAFHINLNFLSILKYNWPNLWCHIVKIFCKLFY